MGTWVRDSGERTTLGSREWSTKNELTKEKEQELRVEAVKGGHPHQAEVCGGAAAGRPFPPPPAEPSRQPSVSPAATPQSTLRPGE